MDASIRAACFVALGLLASGSAAAQGSARSSGFDFSLDTSFGHVDGRRFDGSSGTELTAELRPGLRFSRRTGLVQGSLSYAPGMVYRSRASPVSEVQHRLSAALTGQVVENRLFIDVSASISRQPISAYGQQSVEGSLSENPNRQEVGTLNISPVLRGYVAGAAQYDLRLNASATNMRKSTVADSTTTGGTFFLGSSNQRAWLAWGLTASASTTDYRATGNVINERGVASLSLTPDPELTVNLRAGLESTNVGTAFVRQTSDNWGASLRWTPSPRTLVELGADRRFFGDSHSVTVSHRMPLSGIRFTSTRDVSLGTQPRGVGQPQTLYDLFFQQFASQEPDPEARQQLVLGFLAGLGLDPNAAVGGGSVFAGPTEQQRQDLALSYAVRRLTLAVQGFASSTTRLPVDGGAVPADGITRQTGYNGSVAWRLTPTAAISLAGSRLMTKPTPTIPGTDLKSLALTLTDRLGPRANAALSARYTVFNSAVLPYRETAVNASLGQRF